MACYSLLLALNLLILSHIGLFDVLIDDKADFFS
jgi:hypothetical protein